MTSFPPCYVQNVLIFTVDSFAFPQTTHARMCTRNGNQKESFQVHMTRGVRAFEVFTIIIFYLYKTHVS